MGRTYPKVIELLTSEVPAKKSRNQFCRETGINPNSFDRYKAGISEPTTATLERIAEYFKVSVAFLRGEESERAQQLSEIIDSVTADEMFMITIKSLFQGDNSGVINEFTNKGLTTEEALLLIQGIGESFKKHLFGDMLKGMHIEIFKPLIDAAIEISFNGTSAEETNLKEILADIAEGLDTEVIKPAIRELAQTPTSELPAIAAIIKRFRENEQFNLDARKLLNNSVAHGK